MATDIQLASPAFDIPRKWIIKKRNQEKSWEFLYNPNPKSGLEGFLANMVLIEDWPEVSTEDWPEVSTDDWKSLVDNVKAMRRRT